LRHFIAHPDRLPLTILDARLCLGIVPADTAEPRHVVAEAGRVGAIWPLVPARTALSAGRAAARPRSAYGWS
jgi:hypothetical protein